MPTNRTSVPKGLHPDGGRTRGSKYVGPSGDNRSGLLLLRVVIRRIEALLEKSSALRDFPSELRRVERSGDRPTHSLCGFRFGMIFICLDGAA